MPLKILLHVPSFYSQGLKALSHQLPHLLLGYPIWLAEEAKTFSNATDELSGFLTSCSRVTSENTLPPTRVLVTP